MAKKKSTVRKTSARLVMDVFHRREAYSEETSIPIEEFKNVPLTSAIISYTMLNFMNDGIVHKTEDDKYYFDQLGWKKMSKKVERAYLILFGFPAICLVVLLLIMNWGDLSQIFFQ